MISLFTGPSMCINDVFPQQIHSGAHKSALMTGQFLFRNFHSRWSLVLGSPVFHHRGLRLELGAAVTAAHGVDGNLVFG